jgi:phosphatidylinositol 4-kinase
MQKKAELGKNLQRDKVKVKGFGPWDLLWEFKYDMIKRESPYNEFPSYMLRQIIVKGGDDLRQEIVAMQLIKLLQSVFQREGASLMLHTYEIVVINSSSGIIGSPI